MKAGLVPFSLPRQQEEPHRTTGMYDVHPHCTSYCFNLPHRVQKCCHRLLGHLTARRLQGQKLRLCCMQEIYFN